MRYLRVQKSLTHLLRLRNVQVRCASGVKLTQSYIFKGGDIQLSDLVVGQVLDRSADKCGDDVAFVSMHQNISKTYSELRQEAERLASGLLSIGLRKGDKIAIYSPNCYEWPLTQFAAAKAGLVLVNINPALQTMELEYCLKKVGCKAVVAWDVYKTQDYYKFLCDLIPELPKTKPGNIQNSNLPNLKSVIMISENKMDGTFDFKDVFNCGNKESDILLSEIEKSIQFDDPVNIQFTSGTTGAPKGAVLNHHSLINNCLIGGRRLRCHLSKQVLLIQVPMFHSYGSVFASIMPILYQCTSVFPCLGFDAVESLKAIQKYKCTISYGTPTMYVDLIRNYKSGNYDISSLKLVISGGAATPETLMKDIQNQLNVPYLQVGYGSTELSPGIAFAKANDSDNAAKGILETIEYVEVKIINDKRHIVPVNTQGEICARGHVTFMGYWGDEEKTKEVLDETGWYHTGDLGVMDEDGCLRIVGRIKDMIIRGGENIYPVEVEEYLSTHPSIQEVHICGVPDERLGEEACAWIHLKEGAELTEQEVKEFCKGKISHFKIPRYVMFVQGFPKTHTGKIKKFEMSKVSKEKLNL